MGIDYIAGDPRGLSAELQDAPLQCVPTWQTSISLDEMRVLGWLRSHHLEIEDGERRYNIDRRAIAGAIAWEALKNPHPSFVLWPGAGKVHSVGYYGNSRIPAVIGGPEGAAEAAERLGYLPERSLLGRIRILRTPIGSIGYIAAIMRTGADIAENRGFIIADKPELLCEFYQGWTPQKWSAHMATKARGSVLKPGDTMALWVRNNIGFLEDAVGKPSLVPASMDTRISK